MKNMRIPLFVATGIVLIGLILGSFLDIELSRAIANPNNTFGLVISVIGPTIGFAGLTFVGGGFIAIGIHQEWKTWIRILFFLAALAALASGVYFAHEEYFGINGFYNAAPNFVGLIISLLVCGASEFLGYCVLKDTTNKKAWIIFLIIFAVLLLALMAGVNGLKSIFHRPRYRIVMLGNVHFHEWWERCADYNELKEAFNYHKDDFKSFPSGHTGEASILLAVSILLPVANNKFKKYQLPLFIGGFAFTLLVAFSRILVAAHYLSDVSMGALLTLVLTIVANEVVIKVPALHEENSEKEEIKQ